MHEPFANGHWKGNALWLQAPYYVEATPASRSTRSVDVFARKLAASPQRDAGVATTKDNTMPKISILFGLFLLILGVLSYVFWQQLGAAHQSITALIPAFVGVLLILFGALSLAKPSMRMHFMHGAVTIALLGGLAALGRFIAVTIRHPSLGAGPMSTLLMTIICGVFVALCVRSFITARRERNRQALS